jgi:hypothetical protein
MFRFRLSIENGIEPARSGTFLFKTKSGAPGETFELASSSVWIRRPPQPTLEVIRAPKRLEFFQAKYQMLSTVFAARVNSCLSYSAGDLFGSIDYFANS